MRIRLPRQIPGLPIAKRRPVVETVCMSQPHPSPALFFETLNAYQRTAALKAAIDLDLFTHLDGRPAAAAELAAKCGADPRGARILADYLTILGFLKKEGLEYALTPDSACFLSRKSPAYAGAAAGFLLAPQLTQAYDNLAEAVRRGGTVQGELGTLAPEHSVWLEFARGMGPMMQPNAAAVAEFVPLPADKPAKVLDISASHGAYGLAFAKKSPLVSLVAADWAPVLEVTRENAIAAGVGDRFSTIAGDAFAVELGHGYDLVLVPNFLHHFSPEDCTLFLRRVAAALTAGGRVVIVEFVPNEDRISPPGAAGFSLVMLGTTPKGDAYTLAEYRAMLAAAGFENVHAYPLPAAEATAIVASPR